MNLPSGFEPVTPTDRGNRCFNGPSLDRLIFVGEGGFSPHRRMYINRRMLCVRMFRHAGIIM